MIKYTRVLLISLLFSSASANSALIAFTDETEYLNALASYSYNVAHEGFEGTAWDSVRSSISGGFITSPSITNLGVTWSSNHSANDITTGSGAAYNGNWGVYSYQHGDYLNRPYSECLTPETCGDGITGTTADSGLIFGIGGWFRTNTPFAKLGLFLDGYPNNKIDFGETCTDPENCIANSTLGTAYEFFGVIDTNGFNSFEFRELEGTVDDAKYIFADDFYIATTSPVPVPASIWLFGSGLLALVGFRRK